MIKTLLKFAADADTRNSLRGIWIKKGEKESLIAEATDGHRLHRMQTSNAQIQSADTDKVLNDEIDKKAPSLIFNKFEVDDMIFKLKEILAIAKLHRKRTYYHRNIKIRITKKRIVFVGHWTSIIRYIELKEAPPKELVGMVFGVNAFYLLEALESFLGDAFTMAISDELSPIIMKSNLFDHPMHLLMPVRLDKESPNS
jgi:DNA polymerase III sliding clamp (beta) subunit (PCNA family)